MPVYRVALMVLNREGARDPEGETLAYMLRKRGYEFVERVRAGKVFLVEVNAPDPLEAEEKARVMARESRLYNPSVHELLVVRLG